MKGIELEYNNQKFFGLIEQGSMHVILGQKLGQNGSSEFYLHFMAFDTDKDEFIDWVKADISMEEEISIKVTEIEKQSKPSQ